MALLQGQHGRIRIGRTALALAAITAAGLALRLFRLDGQSFWFDEAQTLFVARLPFAEIVQRAYRPPLYHLLLHVWSLLVCDREFWLRLPSALFGAAVPPLAYLLGSRLYGRRVGLLAALFGAISPTMLWYSQELRMYSLMALEFMVLTVLSPGPSSERSVMRVSTLIALFLVEVASLYTHYFAIPFLLWLGLASLLILVRQRRWRDLKCWLAVQVAAGLAFIPWLIVIRGGRGGTEDYLTAEVNPVMPAVPRVREFLIQTWQFYTNGPVTPDDTRVLRYLWPLAAILLGVILVVLAALALAHVLKVGSKHPSGNDQPAQPPLPRALGSDVYLLGMVLGPLLTATLMFKLRPGIVHPRHLMMVAGPLVILLARVSSVGFSLARADPRSGSRAGPRSSRRVGTRALVPALARLASLITGLAFVGLFLVGLVWYFQHPERQRPDVRSLARHVEAMTQAGDVVLLPYTDYAFDYYFQGPAKVYHLETRVGDADLAGWLLPRIQGAKRAVLLRWVHSFADARDFLLWLLQANGELQSYAWDAERWVSVYDLNAPLVVPVLGATDVRFDPLHLRGASFPLSVPADQAMPIALQWEMSGSATTALKASVKVLDPLGFTVAQADRVLLSEQALATTDQWASGLSARNYYFLNLPPGTPPVTHTLVVSVYDEKRTLDILSAEGVPVGTTKVLGQFQVEPPANPPTAFAADTPMTVVGSELAPGLQLEGYSIHPQPVRSGEFLNVFLYWRATAGALPAYRPAIQVLSPSGEVIGSQRGDPGYGLYPFDLWREGEIVIDRRQVLISSEAESGADDVRLSIEGQGATLLQQVMVEKSDRQLTLPAMQHSLDVQFGSVVRLKGFDLEKEAVKHGEPPRLTLYWQAVNEAPVSVSYVVFAHLLGPQNQMVAQHDGPPASARWPSTTWVKGQIITDVHELAFKDETYEGETVLEVGLYDPKTFERLKMLNGEDRVILPIRVTVLP